METDRRRRNAKYFEWIDESSAVPCGRNMGGPVCAAGPLPWCTCPRAETPHRGLRHACAVRRASPGGGWDGSQEPVGGTFVIGVNGDVLVGDGYSSNLSSDHPGGVDTIFAGVGASNAALDSYGNLYFGGNYNANVYKVPYNSATGQYVGWTTTPTTNCVGGNQDTAPASSRRQFRHSWVPLAARVTPASPLMVRATSSSRPTLSPPQPPTRSLNAPWPASPVPQRPRS